MARPRLFVFLAVLLLLLVMLPCTSSKRPNSSRRPAPEDYTNWPSGRQPIKKQVHSEDCKQLCTEIESSSIDLHKACNKYRRSKEPPSSIDGKTLGDICSESLLKAHHLVCLPACALEDATEYQWPKVAKCTGMGTPTRLAACEAGFFAGVEQTVGGLGVDVKAKKQEAKERAERELREKKEAEAREKAEAVERAVHEKELERIRLEAEKHGHDVDHGNLEELEASLLNTYDGEGQGKSEAMAKSEERAKVLLSEAKKKLAEEGEGVSENMELFVNFSIKGKEHTIGIPYGGNLPNLVAKFCRRQEGSVGKCQRDVLMQLKLQYPWRADL